jgi:HEAT repeat protein/cyclophilin family peptidyl-prolyl cis-trans isomerase
MMRQPVVRLVSLGLAAGVGWSCASTPVAPPTPAKRPALTFEQKMGWILRLEEDRMLELPAPPAPPPPPAPAPGRGRSAPAVAPPPPPPQPDLVALLKDDEARVRRRAALAIGRTRVAAGAAALTTALSGDQDPEVRQMAAFALGLLGQASAADALIAALKDPDPLVQGRAAEALGLIGHKAGADAIGAMMTPHVAAGVLSSLQPDDLEYPKASNVEAVRLGMYGLVRLGAFQPLAAVLTTNGTPVSRWWPVAYAFRRVGDPQAGPILLNLLQGDGTFTRAFAARGLGAVKETRAVDPLVAILGNERDVTVVRIEAARSLAELGAAAAAPALTKILMSRTVEPNLRLEAATALGQLGGRDAVDLFIDLVTDPWPAMRGAALTALARADSDTFVTVLSGLDADPQWSVRAAMAAALATLGRERAQPRLMAMLQDSDQRVIPAVLTALVTIGAPEAEAVLIDKLTADDPIVRQAAASGLAKLKSPKASAALLRAYDVAEKDPPYVARAAILAALVDTDGAAARPLIERALGDRDWAIRVRAASLLRTLDPSADLSKMRPAPASPLPELNDLPALTNPPVSPMAYIDTDKGMIQIELAVLDAPRTVANFVSLARRNFLGATPFHRIVANFVVQDGDSRGDGEGGPGYTIRDEINQRPYLRGTVGMALDWEDTGGSQFFIALSPQPHLDARYTVFGRVVSGMEVADRLTQGDLIKSVRIWDGVNWIGGQ